MTIGVTGGIGSGKSLVCKLFEQWGAELLDADKVGHEVLTFPEVKADLVEAFGKDILREDGSIDRRALGAKAFRSDESRVRLTDVVWPAIGKRMGELVEDARSRGVETLVIEASLLLERGDPEGLYETVVVVTAPEPVRIARTIERDGITEEAVRDRMRHQMPEAEKIKHADHVIVNDVDFDTLEARAREVWAALTGKGSKE